MVYNVAPYNYNFISSLLFCLITSLSMGISIAFYYYPKVLYYRINIIIQNLNILWIYIQLSSHMYQYSKVIKVGIDDSNEFFLEENLKPYLLLHIVCLIILFLFHYFIIAYTIHVFRANHVDEFLVPINEIPSAAASHGSVTQPVSDGSYSYYNQIPLFTEVFGRKSYMNDNNSSRNSSLSRSQNEKPVHSPHRNKSQSNEEYVGVLLESGEMVRMPLNIVLEYSKSNSNGIDKPLLDNEIV